MEEPKMGEDIRDGGRSGERPLATDIKSGSYAFRPLNRRSGEDRRKEREKALPAFGDVDLALPEGGHIEHMTAAGDRLMLRTRMRDGSCLVHVVDLRTGKLLGSLTLTRP